MFCRNCGRELTGNPEICTNCGANPTAGTSFCPACGAPTTPLTDICAKCGMRLAKTIKRNTWKTKTAGILAIVVGAVGVVEWVAVAALVTLTGGWLAIGDLLGSGGIVAVVVAIVIAIGIVAIVGGVFALKRKRWGLALAGSICALFSLFFIPILLNVPLAIAAIVLVVLGKGEFD
jgi:hypothetical protein